MSITSSPLIRYGTEGALDGKGFMVSVPPGLIEWKGQGTAMNLGLSAGATGGIIVGIIRVLKN